MKVYLGIEIAVFLEFDKKFRTTLPHYMGPLGRKGLSKFPAECDHSRVRNTRLISRRNCRMDREISRELEYLSVASREGARVISLSAGDVRYIKGRLRLKRHPLAQG